MYVHTLTIWPDTFVANLGLRDIVLVRKQMELTGCCGCSFSGCAFGIPFLSFPFQAAAQCLFEKLPTCIVWLPCILFGAPRLCSAWSKPFQETPLPLHQPVSAVWWAVKRRWDLLLIKWVRKSVPQTYYGSWGLSRRDFTLRWKFSMYLCSRLLVASNIHMSISCVETPWTWSPHSLPGFRDHRPSSVSFSLPQTNSLTFTVYHRGAYKQDKSLPPGPPLPYI